MSLNRTLDRLFDEIRREAKRNPEFAQRLDAVLRLHESRREIEDEVLVAVARGDEGAVVEPESVGGSVAPAAARPPLLNPVGLFKREGEAGLEAALAGLEVGALRALIAEHNLDPTGVTETLSHAELAAHIVARAKRRAERDEKMFDY